MAIVGIQAGKVYRRARLSDLDDEGTDCFRLAGEQGDGGGEEGKQGKDEG